MRGIGLIWVPPELGATKPARLRLLSYFWAFGRGGDIGFRVQGLAVQRVKIQDVGPEARHGLGLGFRV